MADYTIKVTTERLVSVSTDVLTKLSNVENAFEQISSTIGAFPNYWEGDGEAAASEHYNIRKDNYEHVFKALKEHVQNLQVIAGVYAAAENSNLSEAEDLPADVII